MARDELFGPGEREFDMSVTKDWRLKERLTAQFRFEVFNVFNKTQYAVPSANLANPTTFGTSQATINLGGIAIAPGAPRQVQLGLRLMF
jgi:outer membrane receptor protein involved in Fe transport